MDDFDPEHDVPFTQYLRPNGRPTPTWIARPPEIVAKAKAVLAAGGRFEIEELQTGEVSATVEHPQWEREGRGPVAIELCANGAAVLSMVDRLVTQAYHALVENVTS